MPAHAPDAPRRSRLLRALAVLCAVFVAYVAFGFLAAPPIARSLLVRKGAAALHRDVEVAKVRVNPLALSATVEGLSVRHRGGAPFVAWESLYVRLAPLRLLARELGLAEVRLVRPSVHVGIGPDGALSFQDLLEGEPPAAPAPRPDGRDEGVRLSIGLLSIEGARVAFDDATRRPAFHATLGPATVRLESFRTYGGKDSTYAFSGSTDAGETFRWSGTLGIRPLRSEGAVAFGRIDLPRYAPYLRDRFPIELHDGRIDVETRYAVEWGPVRRIAAVADGRVIVNGLSLGPLGVADAPVRLPRIEVTGIGADAIARRAEVGAVSVRGGTVRVLREPDGALELSRMAPGGTGTGTASPPWRWSVGAVAISGVAVDVEDRAPARPVVLPLTDVSLRVERLRDDAGASWPVSASLVWAGRGRLGVKGMVQPFARKGTLAIDAADLDLVPLAPYLERALAARLAAGRAGAGVSVVFDASEAAPAWRVAGDARLDGLAITEKGNEELLRWEALELAGIDADAGAVPPRARVRRVRLVAPRTRVVAWEDGTTSASRAIPASDERSAPTSRAPPGPRGPEWRTRIDAVEVVRGRATVVDRSIAPAALVTISRADARVTSLSSDRRVRSSVDARLEVEGASPVAVSGTMNPLQKDAYTDLAVTSHGVDLSPLDPYARKFLGYRIQKGKLDLDLRYRIEARALAATNVVKVHQLTLGERTDSPDATRIPVRLALALLQDTDGVILLDVPVEGNLDDPEFRLGRVVWHTILNVLTKVATSPFRALAALVGGQDVDLSMVEFAPGTAEPVPEAQQRLAQLARSLAQRPALVLELEGAADAERDGPALRRAALERSLLRARGDGLRVSPASTTPPALAPEERARLVRDAYAAAFPTRPAGKQDAAAPPPTPEQMEERLAATMEVPPDAYGALARERAVRARDALVAAGLDQSRLFLAEGGRAEHEKGARVYFTVR